MSRAEKYKQFLFALSVKNDADVIEYLETLDNRTQFLRDAVRFVSRNERKDAGNDGKTE